MPDARARVAQRVRDRALLDVHVVDVRLHAEVVQPQFVDVVDRLVQGGQHLREPLVGVQRLQQDGDAARRRVRADLPDRLPEVVAQLRHRLDREGELRDRRLRRAQLREAGAQVRCQVDDVLGVLHGVGARGGVGAGQVALLAGVVVAPRGQHFRHRQAVVLDPLAPLAGIHRLRVAGQVDSVVARLPGRCQNHLGLFEHMVSDPLQGVALQAVLEGHGAILPDGSGWRTGPVSRRGRSGPEELEPGHGRDAADRVQDAQGNGPAAGRPLEDQVLRFAPPGERSACRHGWPGPPATRSSQSRTLPSRGPSVRGS